MSIEIRPEAVDRIVANGFDPVFGARPLKRAIQNILENPLAEGILDGTYAVNDKLIVCMDSEGKLVISKSD